MTACQVFLQGKHGFDASVKELGRMMQRWLASVLLYCEKGFHKVNRFVFMPAVVEQIEAEIEKESSLKMSE